MILYVDKTCDSEEAIKLLRPHLSDLPLAPAEGSGLPELVVDGVPYVGLRAIKSWIAGSIGLTRDNRGRDRREE